MKTKPDSLSDAQIKEQIAELQNTLKEREQAKVTKLIEEMDGKCKEVLDIFAKLPVEKWKDVTASANLNLTSDGDKGAYVSITTTYHRLGKEFKGRSKRKSKGGSKMTAEEIFAKMEVGKQYPQKELAEWAGVTTAYVPTLLALFTDKLKSEKVKGKRGVQWWKL